jgi:tetratricopeptide (TPR) repeat protein
MDMRCPRFAPAWAIVFATATLTFAQVGKTAPLDRERLTLARYRTFAELLAEGEQQVVVGNIEQAIALYTEAQTLSSFLEIGANSWNKLCWYGSLWGYADRVLDACETAVSLAPNNINIIDSRGVARALVGDTTGAIEDFTTFVEGAGDDIRKFQRQDWIDALKKGVNPFTPEVLRLLFVE